MRGSGLVRIGIDGPALVLCAEARKVEHTVKAAHRTKSGLEHAFWRRSARPL